ncbi:MAG: hypothetical protein ACSHX0_04895 [Akkermansiaceae bacterium]
MNNLTFILTTLSLGVMTGISGSHYFQVKTMVERYEITSQLPVEYLSGKTLSVIENVKKDFHELPQDEPESILKSVNGNMKELDTQNSQQTYDEALLKMAQLAQKMNLDQDTMRAKQEAMSRQLAETNRDLAEANFRLDAQSDSFKPLRVDRDAPSRFDGRAYEFNGDEDLLPSK